MDSERMGTYTIQLQLYPSQINLTAGLECLKIEESLLYDAAFHWLKENP